jgi:hypothetical protein
VTRVGQLEAYTDRAARGIDDRIDDGVATGVVVPGASNSTRPDIPTVTLPK